MNTFIRGGIFIFFVFLVVFVPNLFYSSDKIKSSRVIRIIDGDTVELANGVHVRLLGVNAPEKGKEGYDEAKDYLRFLEGKEVMLEWTKEEKDKYFRDLRYVFYGKRFINRELIMNGLVNEYIFKEDKYSDELRGAENFAMKKDLGLWKRSSEICSDCIFLRLERDSVKIENNCAVDCDLSGWMIRGRGREAIDLDFFLEGKHYELESFNETGDLFLWGREGFVGMF